MGRKRRSVLWPGILVIMPVMRAVRILLLYLTGLTFCCLQHKIGGVYFTFGLELQPHPVNTRFGKLRMQVE